MSRQQTKLSWGVECGPDRRQLEEQLRAQAGEAVRKFVRVDAREAGSGYVNDPTDGYAGDLWSGLDEARDRGEG